MATVSRLLDIILSSRVNQDCQILEIHGSLWEHERGWGLWLSTLLLRFSNCNAPYDNESDRRGLCGLISKLVLLLATTFSLPKSDIPATLDSKWGALLWVQLFRLHDQPVWLSGVYEIRTFWFVVCLAGYWIVGVPKFVRALFPLTATVMAHSRSLDSRAMEFSRGFSCLKRWFGEFRRTVSPLLTPSIV